jgi:hypothetical protein
MEVTEIILVKTYRFFQLSSHGCGFFKFVGPGLWISWEHKTPSFDTNMLPKIAFDRLEFVKFIIFNNFKQNIDETDSKQPKIHRKVYTSIWILKISRKKSANQKSQD